MHGQEALNFRSLPSWVPICEVGLTPPPGGSWTQSMQIRAWGHREQPLQAQRRQSLPEATEAKATPPRGWLCLHHLGSRWVRPAPVLGCRAWGHSAGGAAALRGCGARGPFQAATLQITEFPPFHPTTGEFQLCFYLEHLSLFSLPPFSCSLSFPQLLLRHQGSEPCRPQRNGLRHLQVPNGGGWRRDTGLPHQVGRLGRGLDS